MTDTDTVSQGSDTRMRLALGLMGAVAGACAWIIFDVLPDRVDSDRLILAFGSTLMGFFAAALAMTGPLKPVRAVVLAVPVGVIAGGGLTLASLRFAEIERFINSAHPIAAYWILTFLTLPFLISASQRKGGWRHYQLLFGHAWSVVVRYAAATLFMGLFWLVLALSDELLGLVDIDIISTLWEESWFVSIVSGAVLGLALAVVNELSDYVSPYLILRLLRLLLPVVLVVVALFLLMVPVRGLDQVFGGLSAAATLLAMGIAAATLVSTAVDESEQEEVKSPLMRAATQGLALLMPILAGLACFAIWLRVHQYGWSPARLTAATAGALVLAYGVFYAVAMVRRGDWPARVRQINIRMALVVIAIATLWLTPVLNAERISANSQVTRFLDGRTSLEALDLDTLYRDWGVAGARALERLEAAEQVEDHDALVARIAKARAGGGRAQDMAKAREDEAAANRAQLADLMVLRPEGASLPEGALDGLRDFIVRRWLEACARTDGQDRPGCVAVTADFLPELGGPEVIVFLRQPGGDTRTETLIKRENGRYEMAGRARAIVEHEGYRPAPSVSSVLDGGLTIEPVPFFGVKTPEGVFVVPH